ncbi:MAG TPA: response regulator, partial [Coriobacteriia bacterium]|nr:response regulator [Coriobacteriia bacterium]
MSRRRAAFLPDEWLSASGIGGQLDGCGAMKDAITVLVVDDDRAMVEMMRTALESEGMRVHAAFDGGEAIPALERETIDVIVLDILMPKVDGWMTLMQIRDNPATADVPVIMLTAKDQDLAKILAFKQGVQQYVTKPFNVAELSARIESLVSGRRRLIGERSRSAEGDFRKLAVRKGGRTVLLSIDDIVYLSARNKSTYAHTYENQYLVDLTFGELERKLSN